MRNSSRLLLIGALVLTTLVGGVALGSWLLAPSPVTATSADDGIRTITVSGQGQVNVAPNICQFTLGIVTQGTTAVAAQNANNSAAQAVAAKLRALGIKETDIKTVGFNLYPVYEDRKDPRDPSGYESTLVPVGYRCDHRIQVTVRNLGKVAQAIDEAVKAGANTADNITYFVEETAQLRQQALIMAVGQARSKADAIATAAGVKILEIKSIQEHGVDWGYYRSPMMYDSAYGAGESMPVLPGEITIRASVTMVLRY